jgi:TonB family protein
VDKSFEGLLFSIIVHVILVVILWNAQLKPWSPPSTPTEITFVERPTEKAKTFVTETLDKQPKDTFEQLKDTADYLSQFTKRVKKQMRATRTGPTLNVQPKPPTPMPQEPQENQRVAGQQLQDREKELGVGPPGGNSGQAMRNVVIGQSSIAEFIPGVEEGAFTALNSDQFTYYTFFARMNEQVRNRWVDNVRNYMQRLNARDVETLSRMDRHTMVEILLTPEGQFSSSVVQRSSGDRELDQTTVEAFKRAAPFPNPPRGMIEGDGLIHLRYGFMVRFRPPGFGPAG